MKFCWVTITVADMERSLAFYTGILGLTVEKSFESGPMKIVFLGNADTQVELICNPTIPQPSHGNDISIGFETPSLDETIERLHELGIPIQSGLFQPNPRIRFLFVRDPDGVKIQFVEHT